MVKVEKQVVIEHSEWMITVDDVIIITEEDRGLIDVFWGPDAALAEELQMGWYLFNLNRK